MEDKGILLTLTPQGEALQAAVPEGGRLKITKCIVKNAVTGALLKTDDVLDHKDYDRSPGNYAVFSIRVILDDREDSLLASRLSFELIAENGTVIASGEGGATSPSFIHGAKPTQTRYLCWMETTRPDAYATDSANSKKAASSSLLRAAQHTVWKNIRGVTVDIFNNSHIAGRTHSSFGPNLTPVMTHRGGYVYVGTNSHDVNMLMELSRLGQRDSGCIIDLASRTLRYFSRGSQWVSTPFSTRLSYMRDLFIDTGAIVSNGSSYLNVENQPVAKLFYVQGQYDFLELTKPVLTDTFETVVTATSSTTTGIKIVLPGDPTRYKDGSYGIYTDRVYSDHYIITEWLKVENGKMVFSFYPYDLTPQPPGDRIQYSRVRYTYIDPVKGELDYDYVIKIVCTVK